MLSWRRGTPTGSIELEKLIFNSVISLRNARFVSFDISNFYLKNHLDRYKYARVRLANISDEFVQEYNLTEKYRNRWIYFEVCKGVYSLPQSGKLYKNLPYTCLHKYGYYQDATTPGLWLHKWQPIIFTLIADEFVIEYMGKRHALHTRDVLKQHYTITEYWKGTKFSGMELD